MTIRSVGAKHAAETHSEVSEQAGYRIQPRGRHALRVVLGTDHRLFTDSLECALSEHGVTVAGRALDPADLVAAAITHVPSICLISARWLGGDGPQILSALHPAIKLVALAGTAADARFTAAARRAGVAAILSPHQQVAELIRTLHRVRVGERPVAAARTTTIVRPLRRPGPHPATSVLDRLTLREQEVLMLIADGHATIEIAQALAITLHTARTHVQSVLAKLGAHSRLEASGIVARSGLQCPVELRTAAQPTVR